MKEACLATLPYIKYHLLEAAHIITKSRQIARLTNLFSLGSLLKSYYKNTKYSITINKTRKADNNTSLAGSQTQYYIVQLNSVPSLKTKTMSCSEWTVSIHGYIPEGLIEIREQIAPVERIKEPQNVLALFGWINQRLISSFNHHHLYTCSSFFRSASFSCLRFPKISSSFAMVGSYQSALFFAHSTQVLVLSSMLPEPSTAAI